MKRFVLPISGGFLVMLSLAIMVAYTMGAGESKLEARYTTTPPMIDGDASDAVWANAPELTLKNGAKMKAVYTDDEIFILTQWADSTFSATRGGSCSWKAGAWVKSSNIEEGAYNEDRLCIFWNINITDFASAGCVTKCHGPQGDPTGAWLENVGERGDMWHMKAARALGAISAEQIGALTIDNYEATAGAIILNGYTDDKVVTAKDDPDFPFDPEDGGRHGDKFGDSKSMFFHNRNSDKTAPLYMETAPENYIDAMVLQQAEIDNGEAVEVAGLSDAQIAEYWAIYEGFGAIVPERVLRSPAGSRGDVRQSATWSDGVWTSEYQRKLVTGYDDDVQFDDLTKPYYFATTIMDNSGGENHDLRDTLETLVFEEFVPIGELPEDTGYVGSKTCSACHPDIAERWQKTPHANYVREATPENVVGDFTQSPTLSDTKAGIPPVTIQLGMENGSYTVTMGDVTQTVAYAFGGIGWKERYLTAIGNSLYILPIQWNLATQEWVPYHLGDWYDTSGAPKEIAKKQAWDRRCAGCHATGNMPTKVDDEFVARFIEDSIGCESCHGPGKEHASTADKTKIINPEEIEDFDRKNEVCGQCHLRGKSNAGTYGYPYDETADVNFRPGDDLTTMFIDGGGYWPDGTSKKHHQQWLDWKQSEHNDNPYERVGCFDCHDPHGTEFEGSLRMDADDNSLCLSCHETHGFEDEAAITRHTNHPVDPAGTGASRCIECHMPKVAKSAIAYDIRSHTFEFLSPEHGIENKMPDSCTGCHDGAKAVAMTQQQAAVEFGTEFCVSCHSESTEYKEWATSKHSESLPGLKSSAHAKDSCLNCHSVDYRLSPEDAKPTVETARASLSCAACHSHDAENEHNLLKPVAEACVECHTMGEAKPGSTPHHAQIEIIKGTGGVGVPDMEAGHSKVNPELCVTCHMYREEAEGEESEELATEGGHTFKPSMDACLKCHGDPQPLEEQVQTEITTLLDGLKVALDDYEDKESDEYKNAKFNRDMVISEGSLGVHNYPYAKALLTYAYSAIGEPIPTAVVAEAGEFTLSLAKGLNMISLPLKPTTPYTARSFAEKLNATAVITLDEKKGRFVGFTPEHYGDGFAIEGGKGYIVNLREAMEMTFSGTMWTNAPSIKTASDATTSAWAFIVGGFIYDDQYKAAEGSKYLVTVKNLRTDAIAKDEVRIAEVPGQFAAVWVDMSRQSVVEIGDEIRITVTDATGKIVSGPMVRKVDVDDIQLAYAKVTMRLGDIIPEKTLLAQNYPNPFNPETWIPYQLAKAADNVTVKIFDAKGQLVRAFYLGYKDAGMYMSRGRAVHWNGRNDVGEAVANGVYFYQLQAGSFVQTRKMVLLK